MTRRALSFFVTLAMLTIGCGSSPTSTDGAPSPTPVFTVRLVAPDSLELTVDNRASPTPFSMDTCDMRRERFEGGEWKETGPIGELLQCGQGGGRSFPAGVVTTLRRSYVAIGSDGASERVRTMALVAEVGRIKVWPDDAVPFFSEPFPGGIKR